MNLLALHHYYSPETIEKLERCAQLTGYQEYTSFQNALLFLDWCALWLSLIGEKAAETPLTGPADLVAFLDALDQAGKAMTELFDDFFQESRIHQPSAGPYISEGIEHVNFFTSEHGLYWLSKDYFERRARIQSRGKQTLLARISARFASR